MRIAGIKTCSFVDGEGIRYVIFEQGCKHYCKGCHNPDTWDTAGGEEVSIEWLIEDIGKHPYIDGITLSGGDPFYQQEENIKLVQVIRARYPKLDIWAYTGFHYEEIKDTELAKLVDVLVPEPFVEELKCTGKYFGSSNQRLYRTEHHK